MEYFSHASIYDLYRPLFTLYLLVYDHYIMRVYLLYIVYIYPYPYPGRPAVRRHDGDHRAEIQRGESQSQISPRTTIQT